MIHIDYGFILGGMVFPFIFLFSISNRSSVAIDSPGFNINFENAPFKLTKEYIEVHGDGLLDILHNLSVFKTLIISR